MAKLLSLSGILPGLPVEHYHVSQSIKAFRGLDAYDITVSGSMTINGITYPYVDGASGSVLMTDGAGNATFQPVFTSASYISSSNVDGPYGMDSIQTSSFAFTASTAYFATDASASLTSLFALSADSAVSSSYALTASYVDKVNSEKFCFVNQNAVAVVHGIGSESVVVQAYEEDFITGKLKLTIPDDIVIDSKDQVTVTFARPTTGCITISGGGFLRSGSLTTAESSSYAGQVGKSLTSGVGIDAFSYNGATAEVVSIDQTYVHPSSSHALTASFALKVSGSETANTASYISSSNVDGPLGMDSILSASFALTASHIDLVETKRFDFTGQTIPITHNLDTENVFVQVYEVANPGDIPRKIQPASVLINSNNQLTLTFANVTRGYAIIGQSGFIKAGLIESASYALTASQALTASYFNGAVEKTEKVVITVQNDDSTTLVKGTPVYVDSNNGTNYLVRAADSSDLNKMPAIGILNEDVAINATGELVIAGEVKGLNTFGITEGRNVYVAAGGGFTGTQPSSNIQPLGVVGDENTLTGKIIVQGPAAIMTGGGSTIDTGSFYISSSIASNIISFERGDGTYHNQTIVSASYSVTSSHAITSSFITGSDVYGPFGSNSIISSSYAVSASHLIGLVDSIRFDFTNQTSVIVNHGLNSEDIIVQVYQDDASTGNLPVQIVPDTITLNSLNQATVDFAVPTTGYIVISQGGFVKSGSVGFAVTASYVSQMQKSVSQGLGIETFSYNGSTDQIVQLDTGSNHFYSASISTASFAHTASYVIGSTHRENVTGNNTYTVLHNLDSEYPIVQAYNAVNREQMIPDRIVSIDNSSVRVDFAVNFSGSIIIQR